MEIEIKHNNYLLKLEKTDFTDENWVDITVENTETGNITEVSKPMSEVFYQIIQLIDTSWVDFDNELKVRDYEQID